MLTYADVCWRWRTSWLLRNRSNMDVCSRMLTHADVCSRMLSPGKQLVYLSTRCCLFIYCSVMPGDSALQNAYAHACWRMLTHADVCSRMLTYAHACWRMLTWNKQQRYCSEIPSDSALQNAYAHACWRMLTHADVGWRVTSSNAYADACWRMLTCNKQQRYCSEIPGDSAWQNKQLANRLVWLSPLKTPPNPLWLCLPLRNSRMSAASKACQQLVNTACMSAASKA
jgi:hypothetical protein